MTPFWTSSGRFSRLLLHTELRLVFPSKRTSGSGTSSKCSSRILTSASSAMSGFCGLPVPSFFMALGAHHVPDSYEPPRARAFYRGEVYPQLPRSTPGGVCGPRLLGSASLLAAGQAAYGLLGLARHLAGLIRDLAGGVLDLLGCSSSGILSLAGRL